MRSLYRVDCHCQPNEDDYLIYAGLRLKYSASRDPSATTKLPVTCITVYSISQHVRIFYIKFFECKYSVIIFKLGRLTGSFEMLYLTVTAFATGNESVPKILSLSIMHVCLTQMTQ